MKFAEPYSEVENYFKANRPGINENNMKERFHRVKHG
jgi:hypothetical protein|tara:strand:- start:55 stop:165 length:111 start_codon:yes stop_codon:yes gene_type:complete